MSSKEFADDAAEGVAEEVKDIDGLVLAGLQDRRNYSLCFAAGVGAVAAPDFAVDDRRLQSLFGAMIRGLDLRVDQEQEPRASVFVCLFSPILPRVPKTAIISFS